VSPIILSVESAKFEASTAPLIGYAIMKDVLILERDELVGTVLADILLEESISAAIVSEQEAKNLAPKDAPLLVITDINRGHHEDLRGLKLVAAMRQKWPQLCAIYLAALWPEPLRREMLGAGERFLPKPVPLTQLIRTVRELLDSGLCGRRISRPPSRLGLPCCGRVTS
jgi:CheY-like chemotaxis protein